MKFGILFRIQDPPYAAHIGRRMRETIQASRIAEEAGFDGVFVPEHHMMDDGYLPSPFPLLGAMAAVTERVHIGTTVHLLPFYNPIQTAEAGAVVDRISGGRLRLGVGLGNFEPEFALMGLDKKDQVGRFIEAIDLINEAWTGRDFDFHGKHYQARGRITPKPSGAKMWIGAMSEVGVRRAARYGCPWPTDPLHNIAVLKHWADVYREAAHEHGTRDDISVVLLRDGWIADSLQEVEKTWWPLVRSDHWMYFQKIPRFITELEPTLAGVECEEDFSFESHRIDRFVVGPAQECIRSIRRMEQELGMDYLILTFRFALGPDHEAHLDCIRRFGAEVIPAFR
jgi:alkanesulfonate monooxygenase SsuD/methylene tetrahydromethanopterin reductase-like flavin-dependent oxidoreductase (luciferase family)